MRLADIVYCRGSVEVQLEHVRGLRFRKSELVWLAGNTFYGHRGIFEPAFLEWLEQDFSCRTINFGCATARSNLTFEGRGPRPPCGNSMRWLFSRTEDASQLKTLSEFGLDILYARAKTKLWSKIERLRGVPELSVADFGTRRRHSFLWQEYVVLAMAANLGSNFIGTSNAFFAHKHDLEAIGTNAHEIPNGRWPRWRMMTSSLKASQYKVLELWQQNVRGRVASHAPGYVWNNAVPGQRAGLGCRLDRPARRQQGSLRCGR